MQGGFYKCCSKQLTIALGKEDSRSHVVIEQARVQETPASRRKNSPTKPNLMLFTKFSSHLLASPVSLDKSGMNQKPAPHTLKPKAKINSNPGNKQGTKTRMKKS